MSTTDHPQGGAGPTLIGREREATLLWQQYELALSGRARVALVAGEPGIGKSALLNQLAARAAGHGAVVLRGGASDAEGMPPYLPFLEALGRYIRTADPAALHEQAGAAATLADILPELRARLGKLPAGHPLPPEQARLRLYEAVGAFLEAIASPTSAVLLLDDLHWADTASLDLLSYIPRHQMGARLLILGAYRSGEVVEHPEFTRMLTELTRQRLLATVAAGPLASDDIAWLATGALGAPPAPPVAELLHRHSEGNPFFAEELLRGWVEAGTLTQTGAGWALAASVERAIPQSILAAVRQRLGRLAPEVVEVLRMAAIVGRTFDPALLATVAGQEVELVESLLSDAGRAQLVRGNPDATWTFGHDKVRECLYQEITAARRRRLHGLIGQALEARSGAAAFAPASAAAPSALADPQQLAELAFHFTRSGDRARGADYALRAAEQAMQTYAPAEALAHYRAALDLIDPHDQRRGALLLGLGEAAILAGVEREALAVFGEAQTWFARAGQPDLGARAALGAGRAAWRIESLPEAQAAFESALALVGERACPEAVEALVDLGSVLAVSLHRQAEGIAYGRRALELAWHLEEPRLVAAASRTVGNLLVRANDLAAGMPLLEQALALAVDADDPAEAAECCACLGMAYAWQADIQRAFEVTVALMEFARRSHDPFKLRHLYSNLAVAHSVMGEWSQAERMIALAQPLVERLAGPEPEAFLQQARGLLAYERGDYPAAEAHYAAAMATFRTMGPGTLVWYLGLLGMAQAAQGKRQPALDCMAEVESLVGAVPRGTMPTGEPLSHLIVMALALGDRDRIERYGPRLLAFRGQYHDALIDRLLGEIATAQGNFAAAQAYLAAAAAAARQAHLRPELARTRATQADLALAQGGRARAAQAQTLLEDAITLFSEMGNSAEERRLRARLRSLGRPGEPAQRTALPAGLSEREAEVLRLVAAGKSNRQIAQELSLSEKTVANHLTNIFGKTGADNRAAAAAFAIRHGLA